MLKDIFKKNNESDIKEKICQSLLDGYVDIKAYRYDDDNNKKLVYHDTGDNTVTNWMRQVIMQMLAGVSFSNSGSDKILENPAKDEECITSYNKANHKPGVNADGCVVSNAEYQYVHDGQSVDISYKSLLSNRKYPLFPTKVLLGTGKEYVSWEDLQIENEEVNPSWYSEVIDDYGSGEGEDSARSYFNELIAGKIGHNKYSGTFGAQNIHDGGGSMLPAITVNDPNPTTLEETPADLANRYGVVGAVKTLYLPNGKTGELSEQLGDDWHTRVEDIINPVVSESGRLLRTRFRGAGRPCFIYFNKTENNGKLDYGNQTANVFVSKENKSSIKYLNRITFRIIMPAQKGSGLNNQYYPYNGYTLKQIGLFNDAKLETTDGVISDYSAKMPCGTLLAIKNIASFTKHSDEEIVFTWTLTI